MKKLLISAMMIFCVHVNAASLSEVQEALEGAGVRAIDWYQKGDTHFAEAKSHIRVLEISLTENKWLLEAEFADGAATDIIEIYGVGSCYRLARLLPQESGGWGDPSPDDKLIASVFDVNIKEGQKNEVTLGEWQLTMEKSYNKLKCSLIKK